MDIEVVSRMPSRLPPDDDHPYRTGPWRPNFVEYNARDLPVVGCIPPQLQGVYIRNTENPVLEAMGRYHPFDGDGMVHAITLADGQATYCNRFVRTEGLAAELEAGKALWAGITEPAAASLRDGWGARGRMKDASSTDVVVHGGRALTTFYQCGDVYQLDAHTLAPQGRASWPRQFPRPWGVSAHPKVDPVTNTLLFFNYAQEAPYMHYGEVDAGGKLLRYVPVPLPGPRLPHDMAFTRNYVVLNDFPLFWDAAGLQRGICRPRLHDLPARFAIVPRGHGAGPVRWFEASPTYVLHFANAYEEGDEIVVEGFHQAHPMPARQPGDTPMSAMLRMLDIHALKCRLHRWRFNLVTGATHETPLSDHVSEFPSIAPGRGGAKHRYVYGMLAKPGWFLFNGIVKYDVVTGETDRFMFADGVYASEAPMAPTPGAIAEDDGYLLTFTTDMNRDVSECWIFSSRDLRHGPVAKIGLPERICHGTHACWYAAP